MKNPSTPARTRAVARFEGTPAPGLRLSLSAEGSIGEDLRYVWVQTQGPEVQLDRVDAERVSFIVPSAATELTFHLVAAGRGGIDRYELKIPLVLHAKPMLPSVLVADAGDDQVAVVGHRVTLNGARSTPRDRLAYRWIKVAGPEASELVEEAWTYSFVPTEPGLYRFILVVAADGEISKHDEVRVSVQSDTPPDIRSTANLNVIERLARGRIMAIHGGPSVARKLADAFEGIAARISLYQTYDSMSSEMLRRVDAILPPDSTPREEWDRLVFEPLSVPIVEGLQDEGLDLTLPAGSSQTLNADQKARLAALFRGIAGGFRAGATGTSPTGSEKTEAGSVSQESAERNPSQNGSN